MDKMKMHSPNFAEENVEKLAALFPNCVTEVEGENGDLKKVIDFDLLRQELSTNIVEGPQERYRLDWPGKREAHGFGRGHLMHKVESVEQALRRVRIRVHEHIDELVVIDAVGGGRRWQRQSSAVEVGLVRFQQSQ